jgi:hypothetical protein
MACALYLDAMVPWYLWISPKGRSPWSVQPVGSYGFQVVDTYARQTKKFVLPTWNESFHDNSLIKKKQESSTHVKTPHPFGEAADGMVGTRGTY